MKKFIFFTLLSFLLIGAMEIKGGAALSNLGPETIISVKADTDGAPDLAVTVTAYSPSVEECDDDPFITAFMKPVREGTIAISRDMEKEFGWNVGDRVHLQDLGVFEVNDRMHHRWKRRVDIFFHDTKKALTFGVKQTRVLKVEKRQDTKA